MRRIWLVLLAIGLLAGTVHAQGDPSGYALRQPILADYVAILPDVVAQADAAGVDYMRYSLLSELITRFGEPELFALGNDDFTRVYETLFLGTDLQTMIYPATWNQARLQSWLAGHSVDLDTMTALTLGGDFTAAVQPVDFTSDGQPEYLFDVVAADQRLFYLARRDEGQPGGYRVQHLQSAGNAQDPDRHLETLFLEDINHDGLTEWVVEMTYSDGLGDPGNCREVWILGWWAERDKLWDWGRGSLQGCESPFQRVSWHFNWPEVTVSHNYVDSWNCSAGNSTFHTTWDGVEWSYEFGEGWGDFSFECTQSTAESQMYSGLFAEAAQSYQNALAQASSNSERVAYVRARLALAYALAGSLDMASDVLAAPPDSPGQMGDLFRAMAAAFQPGRDVYAMCLAAYDYFADINAVSDPAVYPYSVPVAWVSARGDEHDPSGDLLPDPAIAGCDPAQAVDALAASHPFSLDTPLTDQLTALGIPAAVEPPGDRGYGFIRVEGQDVQWRYRISGDAYLIWRPEEPSDVTTGTLPNWSFSLDRMGHLIDERDFAEALAYLETVTGQTVSADEPEQAMVGLDYWRAFMQEASGDVEAALAGYVTIYEAAPDSAWGLLANLHLEPIVEE